MNARRKLTFADLRRFRARMAEADPAPIPNRLKPMPVTTYKSKDEWKWLKEQHVYLPEMIAEPLRELNRREGDLWRVKQYERPAHPWWLPWREPGKYYELYYDYGSLPPEASIITAACGSKAKVKAYLWGYLSGLDRAESR